MIVVQETTDWGPHNVPNHIYFLTDNKSQMLAFINGTTGKSKIFSRPLGFSIKGRTFTVLRKVDDLQSNAVAVSGSKGDVYYVTEEDGDWKCTCTGFKYHGTCKHIEKVRNGQN